MNKSRKVMYVSLSSDEAADISNTLLEIVSSENKNHNMVFMVDLNVDVASMEIVQLNDRRMCYFGFRFPVMKQKPPVG